MIQYNIQPVIAAEKKHFPQQIQARNLGNNHATAYALTHKHTHTDTHAHTHTNVEPETGKRTHIQARALYSGALSLADALLVYVAENIQAPEPRITKSLKICKQAFSLLWLVLYKV